MQVRDFNLPIAEEHVLHLVDYLDANADGKLNFNEFCAKLQRFDGGGTTEEVLLGNRQVM